MGFVIVRLLKLPILLLVVIFITNPVSAIPELLDGFNFNYKTSNTNLDSCELCHQLESSNANSCGYCHAAPISEKGKKLNPYGKDLNKHLDKNLKEALKEIEDKDSNEDGVTNIKKIRDRLFPGEKKSKTENDDKIIIRLLKWVR